MRKIAERRYSFVELIGTASTMTTAVHFVEANQLGYALGAIVILGGLTWYIDKLAA